MWTAENQARKKARPGEGQAMRQSPESKQLAFRPLLLEFGIAEWPEFRPPLPTAGLPEG